MRRLMAHHKRNLIGVARIGHQRGGDRAQSPWAVREILRRGSTERRETHLVELLARACETFDFATKPVARQRQTVVAASCQASKT